MNPKEAILTYESNDISLEDILNDTLQKVGDFLHPQTQSESYSEFSSVPDSKPNTTENMAENTPENTNILSDAEVDRLWGFYDLYPSYINDAIEGRLSLEQSIKFDLEKSVLNTCTEMLDILAKAKTEQHNTTHNRQS